MQAGTVFAFNVGTTDKTDVYKLYPLPSNDTSIGIVAKQMALAEIRNSKMDGTELPQFRFTDVKGNEYDNASTKGKIIVLKCWFIHCIACVKEFPELNKLVNKYKRDKDVLFISLALDEKEELNRFLKTHKFLYEVVPHMQNFMTNDLHISEYPTHLLIDKEGIIRKVTNSIDDLIPFLDKISQ